MKTFPIPPFLHDVLGSSQPVVTLALIALFGASVPVLLIAVDPGLFADVPLWRGVLAGLLIVDIAAGCIANFTPATSGFYAVRPSNRRIFIGVHVHIIAVALLLDSEVVRAIMVWAYAVAGAILVNALAGNRLQPLAGGAVLGIGLVATSLWMAVTPAMLVVMQLFLLKLVYAFAVDHYRDAPRHVA